MAEQAPIVVLGAGVGGLVAATVLAERRPAGRITVVDPAEGAGRGASHLAGGMLAPWCEAEAAGAALVELARPSIGWWDARVPGVARAGSLVVAPARDAAELERFAARTTGFERLDADGVARLEPALAGRFARGLFFPGEAHLEPRVALTALAAALRARGVCFATEVPGPGAITVDCRGIAAAASLPDLRGVRGEMLMLHAPAVVLRRPVRLLHPRFPLYVVPRPGGRFMVGATMIEGGRAGPITVRSAVELLNAAYALHEGFAEAAIIETGAALRPAYPDNMPALRRIDAGWSINGFFRHGFLLAPVLGERLAAAMMGERGS